MRRFFQDQVAVYVSVLRVIRGNAIFTCVSVTGNPHLLWNKQDLDRPWTERIPSVTTRAKPDPPAIHFVQRLLFLGRVCCANLSPSYTCNLISHWTSRIYLSSRPFATVALWTLDPARSASSGTSNVIHFAPGNDLPAGLQVIPSLF